MKSLSCVSCSESRPRFLRCHSNEPYTTIVQGYLYLTLRFLFRWIAILDYLTSGNECNLTTIALHVFYKQPHPHPTPTLKKRKQKRKMYMNIKTIFIARAFNWLKYWIQYRLTRKNNWKWNVTEILNVERQLKVIKWEHWYH